MPQRGFIVEQNPLNAAISWPIYRDWPKVFFARLHLVTIKSLRGTLTLTDKSLGFRYTRRHLSKWVHLDPVCIRQGTRTESCQGCWRTEPGPDTHETDHDLNQYHVGSRTQFSYFSTVKSKGSYRLKRKRHIVVPEVITLVDVRLTIQAFFLDRELIVFLKILMAKIPHAHFP